MPSKLSGWRGHPDAGHITSSTAHTNHHADTGDVPVERITWFRLPVRSLDKRYGRALMVYREKGGAILVHYSPWSRQAKLYGRITAWMVCEGNTMVICRYHYLRRSRVAPLRWASKALRDFRKNLRKPLAIFETSEIFDPYLTNDDSIPDKTQSELMRELRERGKRLRASLLGLI